MQLPDKPTFRPDEVARICEVSKSTVYSWLNTGKLKAVKVAGTTWRIQKAAVAALFAQESV